ncbi:MAG: TlpA family protein disulfide reductase [Eubacteriaceae bacterium]|nr:TlpA family protein disulfide reductase [Eubacteriaceae bacterium]
MENKSERIIVIMLALVMIMATGVACAKEGVQTGGNINGQETTGGGLSEGVKAPDFTLPLLGGGEFVLSENKGKVVFVNFWATWCPPCVAEMPAIQQLYEKYQDTVVFIGVDCGEEEDVVENFATQRGFSYNIGLDGDSYLLDSLYPSDSIPYTTVIGPDGAITKIFVGGGESMFSKFEEAIIAAMGK